MFAAKLYRAEVSHLYRCKDPSNDSPQPYDPTVVERLRDEISGDRLARKPLELVAPPANAADSAPTPVCLGLRLRAAFQWGSKRGLCTALLYAPSRSASSLVLRSLV